MQGVDPRIEELHRLAASPEPPRRLHAFLRLEERLEELPEEPVRRLVDLAVADPDPQVVAVGRRLREAVVREARRRTFPAGGRSVLEIDGDGRPEEREALGDQPARPFGLAADSLLSGLVDALQTRIGRAPPGLVPSAIHAAGELRHPGLLPALEARADAPDYAADVARALSGWTDDRAKALLETLASRPGPGRVPALAALDPRDDEQIQKLLLQAAEAPEASVRRAGALGLGRAPTLEGAAALRTLLEDGAVEVQQAAVGTWARQDVPDVLEVLLEKLKFAAEDVDLRARIVTELRDLRSPDAQAALELLLHDPDQRVKANAVEALGGYELTAAKAIHLFRPLTIEGSARVRGNAVLSLSLAAPPAATEALLELFDCYEAPVRRAAAYCAGMIQSPRATERLALMMRTEQSQDVLGTAIRALAKIRGPRAIEVLQEFAARKSYGAVGVAAIDLLADLGQASAVPTLTRLARSSEDPAVRAAAARAISRLASHQGLSHLPRLLADPSEEVVITAIEGLEGTGSLEAIGLLTPLLGRGRPRVRAVTITALWYLGEFSAMRTLEELVRSDDEAEALAGFGALERLGRSLRVARLGTRPVLRLALWEAFRRTYPEESAELRAAAAEARAAAQEAPSPETPTAEPESGEDASIEILESAEAAAMGAPPEMSAEEADAPPTAGDPSQELKALQELEASYDQAAPPPREALEELSRHPRSPALLQVALRMVAATKEAERIGDLSRMALAQDEFSLTPLAELAGAAGRRGDVKQALELQLRAAEHQLREAQARIREARQGLAEGNVDEAQAATRLLGAMLRSPPRLHALLGDYAQARGRYAEARSHFVKAFLAFPGEATLALKLAAAAIREGRPDMAKLAAKAAYRRDPDGPDGARARALMDLLKNRQPKS